MQNVMEKINFDLKPNKIKSIHVNINQKSITKHRVRTEWDY